MGFKKLRLPISKKWFDLILSGEKKEEYREIKEYWIRHLVWHFGEWGQMDGNEYAGFVEGFIDQNKNIGPFLRRHKSEFAFFTSVEFTNGYGDSRPKIEVEFKGISIGKAKQGIGGELFPDNVFIIKLGDIIKTKNLTNAK